MVLKSWGDIWSLHFFFVSLHHKIKQNKKLKSMSKFYNQIKSAVIEREVEDVYNKGISLYFTSDIKHPFACDGLIETKTDNNKMLKLIIEYKFDEEMTSKVTRSKIIAQVLFYLKRFENDGMILPNVCLIGDINECFCFHTNDILSYLDEDVDWTLAPSSAGNCTDLVLKIANDENINPYIFDIDENFSFKEVAEKIKSLADSVQRYVRVTEHNISNIFDYFCKKVVKDAKKIAPNDLVAIFMGIITDVDEYYQHPTKKNVLVCKGGKQIAIKGDGFQSFFSYFNRNYTPQEKNKFAEISDRLIEDTNRRNKGEFYTPTLFVDYAHKMIAEQFGEDWKEKYVVWDNCCGTKNLTRDYYFKELYCSTLENAELAISDRYNREGVSFQFDFLNDSLDKLPQGLKSALEENKPIIFFLNPPYATSASGKGKEGKGGVSNTMVYDSMTKNKIGGASQNLYLQFLYRIMMIKEQYNLTNVHICLFSPLNFLSGANRKSFRESFFKDFSFNDGVLFKASHFADVADSWGVSFSIWNCAENTDNANFNFKLIDNIDGDIQIIGEKLIYNLDNELNAADWLRSELKEIKENKVLFPHLSNAIKVVDKENQTLLPNSLGSICALANNVDKSVQGVAIFSSIQTQGTACISNSIIPLNFEKCVSLFSGRKLVESNWINSQDEYLAPNTESEKWQEFVNDSIVFSLFSNHSQQSSLRQVEYKDKLWDIKNEFFFMSKNDIMSLASENGYDFTFNDANVSNERYVYAKLQGIELSAEAKAVLDLAIELTKASFKYRGLFDEEHSEYQIMNWDCGWYQIKGMLKEYMPNELKEFNEVFKALADKMRPMVYELGFLK